MRLRARTMLSYSGIKRTTPLRLTWTLHVRRASALASGLRRHRRLVGPRPALGVRAGAVAPRTVARTPEVGVLLTSVTSQYHVTLAATDNLLVGLRVYLYTPQRRYIVTLRCELPRRTGCDVIVQRVITW